MEKNKLQQELDDILEKEKWMKKLNYLIQKDKINIYASTEKLGGRVLTESEYKEYKEYERQRTYTTNLKE